LPNEPVASEQPREIYNGLDSDLYNLFNVVKFHPDEFIKEFKWMINCRKLFKQTLESTPLTDIQRAAKFFYLIQRSYGARMGQFAYARNGLESGGKSHFNIINRVMAIAKRLDKVIVENLDFEDVIRRYDCESAFFYFDPPYSKGTGYAVTSTKDFEHERLCECLKKIKGKWLLSYDDSDFIRNLYKDFTILTTSRDNNLSRKRGKFKELFIKNYP
jgi:DNA adenine methylase